ncbi:hypothetical protein SDC9_63745 [bioreactor metagenome]|uniref:Uncharacterized protein n=1 Tax=bioreactor metagenome TaxID=1076179 RepID=A0A644XMD1_9ZZZZ
MVFGNGAEGTRQGVVHPEEQGGEKQNGEGQGEELS